MSTTGADTQKLTDYMIAFLQYLEPSLAGTPYSSKCKSLIAEDNQNSLIEFLNTFLKFGYTASYYAVRSGSLEMVEFCLKVMNEEKLFENKTCCLAAGNPKFLPILDKFIADKRFKKNEDPLTRLLKNTPLDNAIRKKNDEAIRKLGPLYNVDVTDVTKLAEYGLGTIDQNNLNKKLHNYMLKMHEKFPKEYRRDPSYVLDPDGNCYGWATLRRIYESLGKEDVFFNALQCVATWDEKLDSLDDSKKQVFDSLISNLVLSQFTSPIISDFLKLSLDEPKHSITFKLLDPGNHYYQYRYLPITEINSVDKMEELFHILSAFPGHSCAISLQGVGKGHAVCVMVNKDRGLKYYDSNFESPDVSRKILTPEEGVLLLRDSLSSRYNEISECPIVQIADSPALRFTTVKTKDLNRPFPALGLNPAHIACILVDTEYFEQMKDVSELFKLNASKESPLDWMLSEERTGVYAVVAETVVRNIANLDGLSDVPYNKLMELALGARNHTLAFWCMPRISGDIFSSLAKAIAMVQFSDEIVLALLKKCDLAAAGKVLQMALRYKKQSVIDAFFKDPSANWGSTFFSCIDECIKLNDTDMALKVLANCDPNLDKYEEQNDQFRSYSTSINNLMRTTYNTSNHAVLNALIEKFPLHGKHYNPKTNPFLPLIFSALQKKPCDQVGKVRLEPQVTTSTSTNSSTEPSKKALTN